MNFKVKPVVTEKSLAAAKNGKYTFLLPRNLSKFQIKEVIGKIFGVKVKTVRTLTKKGVQSMNIKRKKVTTKTTKKAIVTLASGQTIDVFGEKSTKKTK